MLYQSLLYIGLSQSVFAAIVLSTKKKVGTSDIILIFCLLTIAARFISRILLGPALEQDNLDFTIAIVPLTFGPYLYLYTKYLTISNPDFNKRDLLHFLPIGLFIILNIFVFRQPFQFSVDVFFVNDKNLAWRILFGLACFTSVLLYTVFTYNQLMSYHRSYKNDMNNGEFRANLLWLTIISTLFISLFTSYFIIGLINAFNFDSILDLRLISSIGLTIMAFTISYFGIRQPMRIDGVFEKEIDSTISFPAKKEIITLQGKERYTKEELDALQHKLETYMQMEKPFLKPDLSLSFLSEYLNINKTQLTYLLNNHMGVNFFTYINSYRLKEVFAKLNDPKNKHLTILAIAYDCGFNSKSTFNGLFKQATGTTPSEYRNSIAS